MEIFSVWLWKTLENIPQLFEFVLAVGICNENILVGSAVLLICEGLGVLVNCPVEPKFHKDQSEIRWIKTLIIF